MSRWAVSSCLALLILFGCNRSQVQSVKSAVRDDTPATVVTIRTTLAPSNRTSTHTIVIGPSLARSTEENGTWRLYDFKQGRITFVDDVDKSFRTESLQPLMNLRRKRMLSAPAGELPTPVAKATGATRPILGVPASQIVVTQGGYQRELWFGRHPKIPPQLFAMMHVSDGSASLRRALQQVDAFLSSARGFPLVDRTEVTYGESKMVVERVVQNVQDKNVPASLLRIPRGYRDAATAPDERRQSASSRPPGRTTPAAGSQSSSTSRTAP